jgi:hypothetical protein
MLLELFVVKKNIIFDRKFDKGCNNFLVNVYKYLVILPSSTLVCFAVDETTFIVFELTGEKHLPFF